MRHHRLLTWLTPLSIAAVVASCNESISPGTWFVTYRANLLGIATIDSILYSPGTGKCATTCNADSSLIKVNAPALNAQGVYVIEVQVPDGATVQADLYGNGTAGGTAKWVAVWYTAQGNVTGDSVTTTTVAATKFTLHITKRSI